MCLKPFPSFAIRLSLLTAQSSHCQHTVLRQLARERRIGLATTSRAVAYSEVIVKVIPERAQHVPQPTSPFCSVGLCYCVILKKSTAFVVNRILYPRRVRFSAHLLLGYPPLVHHPIFQYERAALHCAFLQAAVLATFRRSCVQVMET